MRERAQIIVESERTQPGSHQYHKYMHIVQPMDSSNGIKQQEWEGITGRVKQLLELQDERVNDRMQQLLELQDERMKQLLRLQDERSNDLMRAIESLDAKLVATER